jgi:hypothetical protein
MPSQVGGLLILQQVLAIIVVGVKFVSSKGCEDTALQTVTIFDIPTVNAGPDMFVLEGGTVTINATASGSNLQYLWTPSTWLNSASVLAPVAAPLKILATCFR